MDYSNTCQGWIYLITNKINEKKYVGQTIDYESRKDRHLKYTDNEKSVLHNAIYKYGVENFEIKVLVTFTAINPEVRKKILDFLEVYYIRKYQSLTTQNGYNLTAGGGGMFGFHHSEKARKKMSESQKLSSICREKWAQNRFDARRPVLLYDLKGRFYREFKSITDALKALGKSVRPIRDSVFKALKDQSKSSYGFLWMYKSTNMFPIFIDPWVDPQWKSVYYYSKDGDLINQYSCAAEAAEKAGVKLRTVKSSLERPVTKKRRRVSNYWSYDPPLN